MTTIAFDGHEMASDTLAVDGWGQINSVDKLFRGKDFLAGGSGSYGLLKRWWKNTRTLALHELLAQGYPDYVKDTNDPGLMLVSTVSGVVYTHTAGEFMLISRRYHAIGSGRDYALAAMHLGRSASEAINLTMLFDVNTGGSVTVIPTTLRA